MTNLDLGILAAAVAVIGSMCGAGVWIVNLMIDNKNSRLEAAISSKIDEQKQHFSAKLDELKEYSISHTNAQLARIETAIGEVKDVLSEHDADLAKTMADMAVMATQVKGHDERIKALEAKRR